MTGLLDWLSCNKIIQDSQSSFNIVVHVVKDKVTEKDRSLPFLRLCTVIVVFLCFFVFPSSFSFFLFLVPCTTLQPTLSVCPSVGRLVCDTLLFRRLQGVLGIQLLPNCLAGLFHHCPCPPARDLGSRVSGLVFSFAHLSNYSHSCFSRFPFPH